MPRYRFQLSPSLASVVTELAEKQGISRAAVLKRAIVLLKLMQDEKEIGGALLLDHVTTTEEESQVGYQRVQILFDDRDDSGQFVLDISEEPAPDAVSPPDYKRPST